MAKYDDALVLTMNFDGEIVVCSAPYAGAEIGDLVKLTSGGIGKVIQIVSDFDGSSRSLAAHFTTIRTPEAIFRKTWSREREMTKAEVAEGA